MTIFLNKMQFWSERVGISSLHSLISIGFVEILFIVDRVEEIHLDDAHHTQSLTILLRKKEKHHYHHH